MSIEDIYKEVARKHDIPYEAVREAHYNLWLGVKKLIASDKGRDVMLTNFGTFYFDKTALMYDFHRNINMFIHLEQNREDRPFLGYLQRYNYLTKKLKHIEDLSNSIEKRAKRKKGERGL